MDFKQAILRAHECGVSQYNTAYILGIEPEQVRVTLASVGKIKFGRPSNIPSAYYTARLAEGYTIVDIAKELGCTRTAVYKTLQKRDIDINHYRAAQQ